MSIKNSGTYFASDKLPKDLIAIQLVETESECSSAVTRIREEIENYRIIGLDTEWTKNGQNGVALVQLSTTSGICFLIRLNLMSCPRSLKRLLNDTSVLKIGTAIDVDVKMLFKYHDILVRCFIDIKDVANFCGVTDKGLAKISSKTVGIQYIQKKRLACSDWEAEELTKMQLLYAGLDAFLPVKILEYFWEKSVKSRKLIVNSKEIYFFHVLNFCASFIKYRDVEKSLRKHEKQHLLLKTTESCVTVIDTNGEAVGYCTRKLKNKILKSGLVYRKSEQPDKLYLCNASDMDRLLDFFPQNRSVQMECALCGSNQSLLRRYIVPHEYLIHLPESKKNELHENVVLLCLTCHYKFYGETKNIRMFLSLLCSAHFDGIGNRSYEEGRLKYMARRLLSGRISAKIKEKIRTELESRIGEPITESRLLELAGSKPTNHISHGQLVVDYFNERLNLDELIGLWTRKYDKMKERRRNVC